MNQKGYLEWCKQEEDKRCEQDLMYRLFRRPETVVDKMLPELARIIRSKYSPDLDESRRAMDALNFLLTFPRASPKIKLFYVLFVVAEEEEAQTVFAKESPHFARYLKELKTLVVEMQDMHFGEPNVVDRVEWFNSVAEILYMSK